MKINDLLFTDIVKIDISVTWLEALNLMEKHDTNGLFVVDNDGKFLGLVTISELINNIIPNYMKEDPNLAKSSRPGTLLEFCDKAKNYSIEKIMNTEKICFSAETKLIEIAVNSIVNKHYRLPVVDRNGKLLGVINRRCIRKIINKHFKKY